LPPDGFITASFSNGVTRPLSQIALANFPAVESLNSVGNNAFVETRESGQPLIGGPQSGQFGSVKSSSLEQSNVDLASQFIRLILNQRAFQANTRTVSTTNELLANLVQLGQ
jgi:flagellar hook protein FlgE